jgi:hypothetical protein
MVIPDRVYFQPPSDVQMEYPCIVYSLDNGSTRFADNKPYIYEQQYEVQLIGRGPQPDKFHQLVFLPKTLHSRSFVADNLNHDVFSIYF